MSPSSAASPSESGGPQRPAWVPMPVDDFLDLFLPSWSVVDALPDAALESMEDAAQKDKSSVWPLLVEALNQTDCADRHRFVHVPTQTPAVPNFSVPQIALYPSSTPKALYTQPTEDHLILHLGAVELLIETITGEDPFLDSDDALVKTGPFPQIPDLVTRSTNQTAAQHVLGQLVERVTELATFQHRVHTYCVLLSSGGTHARLIRWDRAGLILTRSFALSTHSSHLCTFFARYFNSTPELRGYDTTAQRATKEERKLLKNALVHALLNGPVSRSGPVDALGLANAPLSERIAKAQSLLPRYFDPACVFNVTSSNAPFILSVPHVRPRTRGSRETAGWWSLLLTTKQMIFMKETWRYDPLDELRERDLRNHLDEPQAARELAALYRPPLGLPEGLMAMQSMFAMDVYEDYLMVQHRRAQRVQSIPHNAWVRFRPHRWNTDPKKMAHAPLRVLLQETYRPLEHITGTYDLFAGTTEVVNAITELWTIAQSVHGDVSMNNIILPMAQVEIHKRMDALNAQKGIGGATDSGPAAGPSSSAIPVD